MRHAVYQQKVCLKIRGGFMGDFAEYLKSLKCKDEIRAKRFTGAVSDENFDPCREFSLADMATVAEKTGEDFVILNLSDVHFTDYRDIMETAPKRSFPTPLTVARLVRAVKPDLITVTGDIVCGKSTVYSVKNFANLIERFGVPWAPVFGNHDAEGNCDLNYLAEVMMSAPHCLMKKGDTKMGVGNYIVGITDAKGNLTKALFMTDSQHRNPGAAELQKQWVKWASSGIKRIAPKAEISMFMHIPLPEYVYGYNEAFDFNKGRWKDGSKSVGHVGEEIACHMDKDGNIIQTGLFEVAKNAGNIKHIFCGHDHLNAFSLEYEGVRLNYAMKISKSAGRKPGYDGGLKIVCGENGIKALDYKTVSCGPMRSAYKINFQRN